MRLPFDSVFTTHTDGSLEPKLRIRIGGVTVGPGFRFSRGVSIAGLDLTNYVGRDFEATQEGDIFVITGIY